jgi:GntR family transcriptional regulator
VTAARSQRTLSGEAKAEQLSDILENFVVTSPPGTRLPSERKLAERYGVARMTVRQAISSLAAKGMVRRARGQGTFVAPPRLTQPATLTSFTEDMAARGMRARSLVLVQEVVPASAIVAERLELPVNEPVIRLERIRFGDGDPVAVERAHLPAERFAGLERANLERNSLYRILTERWNCALDSSEQRVAAVALAPAEAHLLRTENGRPALRIERVTRDTGQRPVEYVRSLYRGDRYELHSRARRLNEGSGRETPA